MPWFIGKIWEALTRDWAIYLARIELSALDASADDFAEFTATINQVRSNLAAVGLDNEEIMKVIWESQP